LLNIHDLTVAPEFRGRGIGRTLMIEAETLARERGCVKLTLEVLEGNAVAQSLYEALGYGDYVLDPAQGRALFWQKKL
ncbi:MAG: GNAT family N-acetyltransferase, partial [Asticcacaulis sp.]